MNRLARCAQKT